MQKKIENIKNCQEEIIFSSNMRNRIEEDKECYRHILRKN